MPYVHSPYPTRYPRDTQVLQAAKDVSANFDALLDLFASFENFLSRLSIYTGIPPTLAPTNVPVKIIVELLSTLAFATKQVKQGRFSKFVLAAITLYSMQYTEKIHEEAPRGE